MNDFFIKNLKNIVSQSSCWKNTRYKPIFYSKHFPLSLQYDVFHLISVKYSTIKLPSISIYSFNKYIFLLFFLVCLDVCQIFIGNNLSKFHKKFWNDVSSHNTPFFSKMFFSLCIFSIYMESKCRLHFPIYTF